MNKNGVKQGYGKGKRDKIQGKCFKNMGKRI